MTLVLGTALPVSGPWATPAALRQVAALAEDLGYHSAWAFQRLLHPVDEEWGAPYHAVLDPLVALSYVAATTSRIRLGVAVLNLPFYPPVLLAKSLATLDRVCDGRLDVGLGIGWAQQEFTAVGASMAGRGARAEEFVAVLRAVLGPDPVEHAGELYRVPPSRVDPKPVQDPLPLLLGGTADAALRRAGRIADGWISSSRTDLTRVGRSIDLVREAAAAAGRDPDTLRFVSRGVVRLTGSPGGPDRRPLEGDVAQVLDDLAALDQVGVTEVFLDLNWDPRAVGDDVDEATALEHADWTLRSLAPTPPPAGRTA